MLRGVLWWTNRLLPVTRTVFDVESWPVRLVFDEHERGAVRAARFSEWRLAHGAPTGAFLRAEV